METALINRDVSPFASADVQHLLGCASCSVCFYVKQMDEPDRRFRGTFDMPIGPLKGIYTEHCILAQSIAHAIEMCQERVLGWPGNPLAVRFHRQDISDDSPLRNDTRKIGYLLMSLIIASEGAPREVIHRFEEACLTDTETSHRGPHIGTERIKIEFRAVTDSQMEVEGAMEGVPRDPRSDFCFEGIQRWLNECEGHPSCQQGFEEECGMPTRLIDLGVPWKAHEPRLIETRGLRANYVALSHCWGTGDMLPFKTEQKTHLDYQRAIPWMSLSQTFKDVIILTQSLGMRYLWIDSICIYSHRTAMKHLGTMRHFNFLRVLILLLSDRLHLPLHITLVSAKPEAPPNPATVLLPPRTGNNATLNPFRLAHLKI